MDASVPIISSDLLAVSVLVYVVVVRFYPLALHSLLVAQSAWLAKVFHPDLNLCYQFLLLQNLDVSLLRRPIMMKEAEVCPYSLALVDDLALRKILEEVEVFRPYSLAPV